MSSNVIRMQPVNKGKETRRWAKREVARWRAAKVLPERPQGQQGAGNAGVEAK